MDWLDLLAVPGTCKSLLQHHSSNQCSCLENPRDKKPGGLPSMGLHRVAVVLEKTLASPLDCKEVQPVHPKGNQEKGLMSVARVRAFSDSSNLIKH